MYFVSIYENRRMKRNCSKNRVEGGKGRMMEGINLTKIY
jgi:hypothetical protein